MWPGVEDPAAQGVEALAFVELAVDSALQFGVGQVPQDEQGADQASVLEQAPGQGVVTAAGLELGEEQRGSGIPELERAARRKSSSHWETMRSCLIRWRSNGPAWG